MSKVLFLTTSIATGGPTGVVARQAQALHQRGLDVAIWGISTPEPGVIVETEAPVHSLGLPKTTLMPQTTQRLAREMSAYAPDVLHLHSYTTHVHGIRAALRVGVKRIVVSFHDFRLGWRRAAICRRLKGYVSRVIVLNETMRRLYQRECGYAPGQMLVLPNAVDTERFAPAPRDPALATKLGIGVGDFVIGCVGGLNPNKGHRFLLQALGTVVERLPQTRLVLVGEGRDRRSLERLARRSGWEDRVIFAGRQREIPRWLSLFSVFVQPSLIESDPLAVHEAMAMGLPIVATNRGGLPELLAEGEAGLLVPPGRPDALAEAILELAADPARARALGEQARRRAVARYNLRDYQERLWELYQSLLAE